MIAWFIFSLVETVTYNIVVVVSWSSTSFPLGFFDGWLSRYSSLFVLSLLPQLFVLISLLFWPSEAFSSSLLFSPLLLKLLFLFVSICLWVFVQRIRYYYFRAN